MSSEKGLIYENISLLEDSVVNFIKILIIFNKFFIFMLQIDKKKYIFFKDIN